MSDATGDHTPGGPEADRARIEQEDVAAAGAAMPGMRGALTPGTLTHHPADPDLPQGDEHRDPPPNAPAPPPPGDGAGSGPLPDPVDKDWVKPA